MWRLLEATTEHKPTLGLDGNEQLNKSVDAVFSPTVRLHRLVFPSDVHQTVLIKEVAVEEKRPDVDQQDAGLLNIKKEEEGLWISQEKEQLYVQNKLDAARFSFTTLKSDGDHQHRDTSISADQVKVQSDEDLNTCGRDSSSSESKVRGNDVDPQLKNLSDSCQFRRSSSCDLIGDECIVEKHNVDSHRKVQTGLKPFCCGDCGQRFVRKGKLSIHMRIHKGQNLLFCEVCGDIFSLERNLKRHMATHTRRKRFPCDVCEESFNHEAGLTKHMTSHTGLNPFLCTICGNRFKHKASVSRHMKVHTGLNGPI
uniref:C2H2-type domain-containing protein n=1 Tax=Nothobranchius furzeri TaxID=105023 RepID=A0A1A8UDP9_NOTFU